MQIDRIELIEKAFSFDWCLKNYVLVDSNSYAKEGLDCVKVFLSNIEHVAVLGDFISERLQGKYQLIPEFDVATRGEIEKVLLHLKSVKESKKVESINNQKGQAALQGGNQLETISSKPATLDLAKEGLGDDSSARQREKVFASNSSDDSNTFTIDLSNKRLVLGLGASICMLVGALCPVATLPIVGSITYVSNGRGDGVFIVCLSLVSVFFVLTNRYKLMRFVGVSSLTLMSFTLSRFQFAISDAKSAMAELGDNPFRGLAESVVGSFGLGWGWLLLISGAVSILVASFVDYDDQKLCLKAEYLNPALARNLKDNILTLVVFSFLLGLLLAAITS